MATYSGPRVSNPIVPGPSHGNGALVLHFPVTLSAAVTTATVIELGYVPAGFRLAAATLEASDLDTATSPALTIHVGDAGSTSRIFASSTVGQAGTAAAATAVAGIGYQWTSKTLITATVAINPGTGAAGTMSLNLIGFIDAL